MQTLNNGNDKKICYEAEKRDLEMYCKEKGIKGAEKDKFINNTLNNIFKVDKKELGL